MFALMVVSMLVMNRIAQLFIVSKCGQQFINGIVFAINNFMNFDSYKIQIVFSADVMIPCLVAALAVFLGFMYYFSTKKNFMIGKEHGTARWGTKRDIAPFIDRKDLDNNIILSATEQLSLSPKMPNPLHNRNKNILVIGGSGKGKSRNIAKPNLCQLNTSFVVTDPKGELFAECGNMLAVQGGYKIKVLNLEEMDKSDKFNFFPYINTEKDLLIVIDNLLANTSSAEAQAHSGDDFWIKSERALLTALFAYVLSECRNDEKNISSVLELMSVAAAREDDEDFVSPLDIMFQELEERSPGCLACYMYGVFKLAAGKTAKSILVSLGVRLAPFAINEVQTLMSEDELDLASLGKEKTALFLIVPETYTTFNFIVCVLYQLMLERLYDFAKQQKNRRLITPVQIIGDEIANIGQIPNLQRYISTMRSYGISIILIFQTLTQVESMDKQNWKTIVGNCDTFIYLGGKEQSTNEYVSKSVGKMTIDQRQTNETKGSHGSYGMQDSTLGRDLLDPSEMEKIPGDECIVMLSGLEPFKSKKYPLEKHPRYKYLADGGAELFSFERRNELNIEEFFDNTSQVVTIEIDNNF